MDPASYAYWAATGTRPPSTGAAPPPASAPPAAPPPAAAPAASWYGAGAAGWPAAGGLYTAPSAFNVAASYAAVAARTNQAYNAAQQYQHQLQHQQQQSTVSNYNNAVKNQWAGAPSSAYSAPPRPASQASYSTPSAPLPGVLKGSAISYSAAVKLHGQVQSQSATSAPMSGVASGSWPPELREYVERAFGRAKVDVDKTATEEQLKDIIQTAIHANVLWSRDWKSYPLPALPSQQSAPAPPLPSTQPPPPSSSSYYASSYRPPSASNAAAVSSYSSYHNPSVPQQLNTNSYSPYANHAASSSSSQVPSAAPTPVTGPNSKARTRIDPPSASFVPLSNTPNKKDKKAKLQQFDEPESSKARRAERFHNDSGVGGSLTNSAKKRKQAWREPMGSASHVGGGTDEEAWAGLAIRGTSTDLEKQYLRLTAPPDPATVRPLSVLRNALALVKRKWKMAQNYAHACEQLKSMRQDLTLQAIKEDFTAEVYEVHARLALENRDLSEFNQCQTQLFDLYCAGVKTNASLEFLSYRVLYFVYRAAQADLARFLVQLDSPARRSPPVEHALAVHSALLTDNYRAFFRLYLSAPNMSAYLMDLFVEPVRRTAYRVMTRAYKPNLSIAWMQTQLAFEDMRECSDYLREQGATISADGADIVLR